jgi:hypothetical protein
MVGQQGLGTEVFSNNNNEVLERESVNIQETDAVGVGTEQIQLRGECKGMDLDITFDKEHWGGGDSHSVSQLFEPEPITKRMKGAVEAEEIRVQLMVEMTDQNAGHVELSGEGVKTGQTTYRTLDEARHSGSRPADSIMGPEPRVLVAEEGIQN